ncbi:hypothetical protein DM84_01755 [Wolbachia pipientis]|nr:hypothetical protein [Wolbachia pipientis]
MQDLTQSLNNEKDRELCEAIYKKVTKERHHCPSPKKGDRVITKCIGFFEDGADPEVLSGLAESLSEQIESEKLPKKKEEYQKYYKYYIENFLPALLRETIQSEKLGPEKIKQVLRITLDIVKQSREEECNILLSNLETKITESTKLSSEEKTERKKMTMELKISDDLRNSQISGQDNAGTPPPSDSPGSRANSPVPSEKDPLSSPVSGRRDSISATLSSVGGDDDLQREEIEDQTQPEQPAKKERNTQENENSGGQANPIGNGNPQKRNEDQPQPPKQNPEEKPKKQENENSEPTKQPNNRNFRTALATCCALSVGCLVAGVVTLGMVGAGLLVMSVVFAIAAVTRYLTPPSSKLTSTDLSPLIDDSKQR